MNLNISLGPSISNGIDYLLMVASVNTMLDGANKFITT